MKPKIYLQKINILFQIGEEYDTEEIVSYGYKILIFKPINKLKPRR